MTGQLFSTPMYPLDKDELHFGERNRLTLMSFARQFIQASLLIPTMVFDNLFSHRRSQIVSFTSSTGFTSTKPVLFYIHYSKNDILLDHEIKTIERIRNLGIQICLIVNSNDPKVFLVSEKVSKYLNDVDTLVVRKNVGHDLGAYRDGYKLYEKKKSVAYAGFFFMNNSVIWFPDKISTYFQAILDSKSDIVAGSISSQYHPHLQTFLFGSQTKIGIQNLELWLSRIKNWRFKRTIISFGELKTNIFFHEGITVQSFPSIIQLTSLGLQKIHESSSSTRLNRRTIKRLVRNRKFNMAGLPVNPSHDYWLEMVELGFPGIKFDLVAKNPSDVSDYELIIESLMTHGLTYEEFAGMLLANKPKSLVFRLRNIFKI